MPVDHETVIRSVQPDVVPSLRQSRSTFNHGVKQMARILTSENEGLVARIAELEAQLAAAKANGSRRVTMKVSEKGALSVYGLGRFPVSLYASTWERLLDMADDIRAFIKANEGKLATKS
jgi:hypothetical protein